MNSPDASPGALGFIGLGQIGAPMASRWLDWPGGLRVFDVVANAMSSFVDRGAVGCASPAEVASGARVISIMVRDDDEVREVLTGPEGILHGAAPGSVVAIHSTIAAATAIELAAAASSVGVGVLDAPVSGGFMGAHHGTLALMVGGEQWAFEVARPVLDKLGTLVSHMGDIGSGTRTKLARNLIHFVAFAATGEAARVAEAAGISPAELGRIVRHTDAVTGGPGAVLLRDTAAPLAADDGLRAPFLHAAALGDKDLRLAIELAAELGVDTPLARMARTLLAEALGVAPSAAPTAAPVAPGADDDRNDG
jgi:3-hydroxyisobutyrate dehydrogenase